jgi:hypothetical protein
MIQRAIERLMKPRIARSRPGFAHHLHVIDDESLRGAVRPSVGSSDA